MFLEKKKQVHLQPIVKDIFSLEPEYYPKNTKLLLHVTGF